MSEEKMKILLVMDPGILVPPKGYGGIERLVDIFAREYLKKGHEVHLLVTKGSYVKDCIIHGYGEEGFPQTKKQSLKAIGTVWRFLYKHRNSFDLIHNFGRLAYLIPVLSNKVKKIMTYEREINGRNIRWINKLPNKNLFFTGCSADLITRTDRVGNWSAVHNGIEFNFYNAVNNVPADAPLFFLGRIERIKGCHTAIAVAKATNNVLVIAGNTSPLKEEMEYYKTEVEPLIDGKQIIYIGAVDDHQKNEWLGKCKAMLFPIEWNEPFGIVMIESMACGTPVIAFCKGSVDEVIDEGVTGFKTNNFEEMCRAVNNIKQIDRKKCREVSYARFDASVIAGQYLAL